MEVNAITWDKRYEKDADQDVNPRVMLPTAGDVKNGVKGLLIFLTFLQ